MSSPDIGEIAFMRGKNVCWIKVQVLERINYQLFHFLSVWPRSDLDTVSWSFGLCKIGIIVHFKGLLEGLNNFIYIECLEQCLAHSK